MVNGDHGAQEAFINILNLDEWVDDEDTLGIVAATKSDLTLAFQL